MKIEKTHVVTFRVTPEQRQRLGEIAANKGILFSDYLRELVESGIEDQNSSPFDRVRKAMQIICEATGGSKDLTASIAYMLINIYLPDVPETDRDRLQAAITELSKR